jgi:hypothetical protein
LYLLAVGIKFQKRTTVYNLVDLNIWIDQCCGSGIRCLFDPWIRDPE